jgi:hypothetical protein
VLASAGPPFCYGTRRFNKRGVYVILSTFVDPPGYGVGVTVTAVLSTALGGAVELSRVGRLEGNPAPLTLANLVIQLPGG